MIKVDVSTKLKKSKKGNYEIRSALSDLDEKMTRAIAQKIFPIANKRIRRLDAQKVPSEALYRTRHKDNPSGTGLFFSSYTGNLKELQSEIQRCISFLNSKTSTVKGAKQSIRGIENRLGVKLSNDDMAYVYDFMRDIRRNPPPGIKPYETSPKILQEIADEITASNESGIEFDIQSILKQAKRNLTEKYEKRVNDFYKGVEDALTF